jgi:hypothetical protein
MRRLSILLSVLFLAGLPAACGDDTSNPTDLPKIEIDEEEARESAAEQCEELIKKLEPGPADEEQAIEECERSARGE